MVSSYQLNIADFCNIPIGDVKVCASLWKLATLFETRIETKKIHRILEFNQSQ